MDQVKKLMAGLQKHGFWIGCGLIAIASVAVGVMATMNVQDNATKQLARIKSAMGSINPVSSTQNHPNDKTTAAWDKVNLDLEGRVFQLWQQNFNKQRVILTWPSEVGTKFLTEIQDPRYLQPELIAFPEPAGLLSQEVRDNYRNYIVDELPKLAPIIKAKWHLDLNNTPTSGIGGMGGPPGGIGGMGPGGKIGGPPGGIGGGPPPGVGGPPGGAGGGVGGEGGMGGIGGMGSSQVFDQSEVVAWDASSQQLLANKVLHGINRASSPKTLDILYAQEDLWIVKALLNVIAKTNGDALERHRAPIKEIRTLSTGQDAGTKMSGIIMVHGAPAGGGMMGPGAPGTGTGGPGGSNAPVVGKPGAGGPPQGNPYGGGASAAATAHPGELRYVDKKFAPRSVQEIKTAMESDAFSDVENALAKRVPFRMTLVMDQRELTKLLVNCGNNELMVEVSQVRYNPQAVSTGSSMGGSGGGPGGLPGTPGGAGGLPGAPGMGGGKGGPGAGAAGVGGEDGGGAGGMGGTSGTSVDIAGAVGLSPYDILVDIFGYVQIYNIPATKKFKLLEAANAANPVANSAAAAPATALPASAPAVDPATQPTDPAATQPAATQPATTGEAAPGETTPAGSAPPATPAGEIPPAGETSPPASDGTPTNAGGSAPAANP